jgi:fido (protein-threonine AMPylation protein)
MGIFFKNRDDQTPIDQSIRFDLIPSHINNMTELYELEKVNIAFGIEWSKTNNKDHLDYFTWIELHKHMLCDVWSFAGVIRKTELNNTVFLKSYEIRLALKELQDNYIFWRTNKTFSERELIAIVHERLLTIHPFKDGNGRWSRLVINMICEKEKLEIPNWGKAVIDDQVKRNQYIEAIKKARSDENYTDLISFMYFG